MKRYSRLNLPSGLEGLSDLALDLRWTVRQTTDRIWEMLDPEAWEKTKNPYLILQNVSQARLEEAARAFGNKGVRSVEFTRTLQDFRLEDFDPLLKAGLLLYDEKEALYIIDPTFIRLIAHRDAL